MVNIFGGPASGSLGDRYGNALAEHPLVKIHNYGKASRPGRKVGHVTAGGDDLDEVAYQARATAQILQS
jgi:5-(carboxyamino)imidazole ribonucleotide synthase